MAQRKPAKRKKSTQQKQASSGFDSLIGSHTEAIEENSKMIALMLSEIVEKSKDKPLSPKDLKTLKSIKRDLKSMDEDLDSLGE